MGLIILDAVIEYHMSFNILKAEKLKNLDIWDMACVKGSVFFFTLFLASVLPVLLSFEWYWYLIPALLLGVRPVYHWYGKQ